MQWEGSRVREGEEEREWGQPLVCEMKKKYSLLSKKKKKKVNPFLVLGNKVRGERKKKWFECEIFFQDPSFSLASVTM